MATPTISDLYSKYTGKVGRTLENDRYFQYLYAMVESSKNTFMHQNHVLHKQVDERWLTTIEDSIKSINKIIEKPRRFIATKEEVVPVGLAKKITADSVRHLSMNTQFIASDEGGNIQPTRILNVSTEESYDLYENRFIYHLIQRLISFIDKRTDIIFWKTGDETKNTMTFESHVDDAYEQIDYKIEINIKNLQSSIENDEDNLNVFMRIDHIRRLVLSLRNSSFCEIMAGCSKVRSPIQRTNLMMKDPDYRTCYKLWQFLESYDEVGYTIDDQITTLEFDEEYMIQMYTNLITNYTVFKSLLETDERRIEEAPKKHRVVKPKFIKQIKEEYVEDRNIPDVEIRQVFLEEVTEAQLAAEAKVEELTELYETTAGERDEALLQVDQYFMQVNTLMQTQAEYEEALEMERAAKAAAEAKAEEDLKEAAEKAAADLDAKQAELDAAILKAADELNAKLNEFEAAVAVMTERLNAKQAELDVANEKAATDLAAKDVEIENIKNKANEQLAAKEEELAEAKILAKVELEAKQAELDNAIEQASVEISEIKLNSVRALAETRENAALEIRDITAEKDEAVKAKDEAIAELNATKADCEQKLTLYKKEAADQLARERDASDNQIKQVKADAAKEIAFNNAAYEEKLTVLKREWAEEVEQVKAGAEEKFNKALIDNEEKIANINKGHADELEALRNASDAKIAEIKAENDRNTEALNAKHATALKEAKEAADALREQDKLEAEEKAQAEAKERERAENLLRMNVADAEKEAARLNKQLEELSARLKASEEARTKAEEKLNQRRGFFRRRRSNGE